MRAELSGEPLELLLFWGHTAPAGGAVGPHVLSQWWPAPFEVGGRSYATAEQFVMARKAALFGDRRTEELISQTTQPRLAKSLGRQVEGFVEATWAQHRYALVVTGNLAKFGQQPDLRAYLLSTGDRVLVEASPLDRIWGIGLPRDDPRATTPSRWRGQNLLGFALMDVRERLRVRSG